MEGRSRLWLGALEKAKEHMARRRRILQQARPAEWRNFTEEQVEVLAALSAGEEGMTNKVLDLLARGDVRFMVQCLLVALQEDKMRRFLSLFSRADELIKDGQTWRKVLRPLMSKALEFGSADPLREILVLAYDSSPPRLNLAPGLNDPLLVRACERGDYETVRVLVSYGYRLRMPPLNGQNVVGEESRQQHWKGLLHVQDDVEDEADRDDIYAIRILRMMSVPAYVFACYAVAADDRDLGGKMEVACECVGMPSRSKVFTYNNSSSVMTVDEKEEQSFAGNTRESVIHYCPGSTRFKPRDDCPHHLECNDPIYRCFDLARLAYECSSSWPEYRTECMEVARSCRLLSAEILDQCRNSREVSVLLQEKVASTRYFKGYTSAMKFPRVRLAIEHNHKEFATHMYCQQFLRREWHGGVSWQGKGKFHKLAYFVVQLLLCPVYAAQASFVQIGRDVSKLRKKEDGKPDGVLAETRLQGVARRYLDYCDRTAINLDSPLNRFLSTIGYFLAFLTCILITVIRPLSDRLSFSFGHLDWHQWYLLIYSSSVLYGYLVLFSMLRSVSHFFNFWRVLELGCHLSCCLSLVLTLYLSVESKNCEEYEIVENVYLVVCPNDQVPHTFLYIKIRSFK